jgi:hypothetical protein
MTAMIMFVQHRSLKDLVTLLVGGVYHLAKKNPAGTLVHNNFYKRFILFFGAGSFKFFIFVVCHPLYGDITS